MRKANVILITAMLIFGSVGLFVRNIDLSSGQIALVRGVIGCCFLAAAGLVTKNKLSWKAIRPNLLLLILSGAAIGFNWILLFQAYRYTTIANATLSYYFAPVFVLFLSPLLLKEKLSAVKLLCIFAAVAGMFMIIGTGGEAGKNHIIGIGYGLLAAVLYAGVVIINKYLKGLKGMETTIIQLGSAALVLLPYILATEKIVIFKLDTRSVILLIGVGIIHTGIAYLLYFTALSQLSGQTIAILSYIDPISAVIFASIIFAEPMTLLQMLGGILVLGATLISEIFGNKNHNKQ
jgi:drug/metabolite transporter (DMT)-like permease